MTRFLHKLWRYISPLRCDWCGFKTRTPQSLGKHRKRCEAAQLSLPGEPL